MEIRMFEKPEWRRSRERRLKDEFTSAQKSLG